MKITPEHLAKFDGIINSDKDERYIQHKKREYYLRAKKVGTAVASILVKIPIIRSFIERNSKAFVKVYNKERMDTIMDMTGCGRNALFTREEQLGYTIITPNRIKDILYVFSLKQQDEKIRKALDAVQKKYGFESNFIKDTKAKLDHLQEKKPVISEQEMVSLMEIITNNPEEYINQKVFQEAKEKISSPEFHQDLKQTVLSSEFSTKSWREKVIEILNQGGNLPAALTARFEITSADDINFATKYEELKKHVNLVKDAYKEFPFVDKEVVEEIISKALVLSKADFSDLKEQLDKEIAAYYSSKGVGKMRDLENYLEARNPQIREKLIAVLPNYPKQVIFPAVEALLKQFSMKQLVNMPQKELRNQLAWHCEIIKTSESKQLDPADASWHVFIKELVKDKVSDDMVMKLFSLFKTMKLLDSTSIAHVLNGVVKAKSEGFSEDFIYEALTNLLIVNEGKIPKDLEKEIQNPFSAILSQNQEYRAEWQSKLPKDDPELVSLFLDEFGSGVPYSDYKFGWQARDILLNLYEAAADFSEKYPAYDKVAIVKALRETFLDQVNVSGQNHAEALKKFSSSIDENAFIRAANYQQIFQTIQKGKLALSLFGLLVNDPSVPLTPAGKINLQNILMQLINYSEANELTDLEITEMLANNPLGRKFPGIAPLNKYSSSEATRLGESILSGLKKPGSEMNFLKMKIALQENPQKAIENLLRGLTLEFESPEMINERLVEIEEEMKALESDPAKLEKARAGVSKILEMILPQDLIAVNELLLTAIGQIQLSSAMGKLIMTLKNYSGPEAKKGDLPWNEQIVQTLIPKLMDSFRKGKFADIISKINNPGPMGRLLLNAIRNNPQRISQIIKFFEKPILKAVKKTIDDSMKEGDEMMQLLSVIYEPLVKFAIRAFPVFVENHKATLDHVLSLSKKLESPDPDWKSIQNSLIETFIVFAGEIQQYDVMVNNILQGFLLAGKK